MKHGTTTLSKLKVRGNEEGLIPGEKKVVRAYDYYESDVKDTFKPEKPFAYMMKGVCRAFMDIAYGDRPYPYGLGKFKCEQTKGIELGDEYGEFVVTVM